MTAPSGLPPIKACLFDMDGLLIDSEDLYTLCTNDILHKYNKEDLPWSVKAQLQGRPSPEADLIFSEWAQLPISLAQFQSEVSLCHKKHFPRSQPLPGVLVLLAGLRDSSVHVALATSSKTSNFHLKSSHLPQLFDYFKPQHRVLGDDPRIGPEKGKPAPDIYLLALETLNKDLREQNLDEIRPEECLVFEDSVPGIESGRRAGMQVLWCPHPGLLAEFKGREKEVLAGLTGQHKDDVETPKRSVNIDGGDKTITVEGDSGTVIDIAKHSIPGGSGRHIDDGWGKLVTTLEEFPYENYGIIGKVSSE